MAAAGSTRSRVSGIQTTKSLFFCTLLSLVCFTSSLIDKDALEIFKEKMQEQQEQLDHFKAEQSSASKFLSEFLSLLEPVILFTKENSKAPHAVGIEGVLDHLKRAIQEANEKYGELNAKMEDAEKELKGSMRTIKLMEELHAEL